MLEDTATDASPKDWVNSKGLNGLHIELYYMKISFSIEMQKLIMWIYSDDKEL